MRAKLLTCAWAAAAVTAVAQQLDLGGFKLDVDALARGIDALATEGARAGLTLDVEAAAECLVIIADALKIMENAERRRARHEADLAARGIAEEPMSREAVRYTVDTHGLGEMLFDDWGELYIDRRFLTDAELQRVKEIEAFAWKHLIEPLQQAKVLPGQPAPTKPAVPAPSPRTTPVRRTPRATAGGAGLPVFRGFEDERYQQYDELIARLVPEFNANKAAWCGGNPDQVAKIADLTPAMVKSHMIEESGGNGPRSKAAWAVDPLQVNVPGDWGEEKALLGLKKPLKRNEGTSEQNVRAAIMYLSRKGFGSSGRPAAVRPKGFFDGWPTAYVRYNGRRDRTETDRYYSEEYSDKILRRAADPELFVPIEIKLAKSSTPAGFTDDYDAALARAKAEGKYVIADFSGSDWCFWCQRLDKEVFQQPSFIAAATNRYVLLMIDSPRNASCLSKQARARNPALVKRYKVTSFPTVLLLDGDGRIVGETGFVGGGPEAYLAHLDEKVAAIPDFLAYQKPLDQRISAFFRRYSEEMSAAVKAAQPAGAEAVRRAEAETTLRLVGELEAIIAEERGRTVPERVAEARAKSLASAEAGVRQLKEFAQHKLGK